MSTLQRAVLTLEADVDGDGTKETGVFHMVGNLTISPSLRTGFLVGGRGSTANSVLSSLIDKLLGDGEQVDPNKRQGIFLDYGGGQHIVQVDFTGWEGAKDSSGTPLQWGNDSSVSRTKASATGQDPLTQIDVLMRYLTVGEYDSRNPATLEYGEYSSDGLYDPLDVVIEGPRQTRRARDNSTFDGTMTFIAAARLTDPIDIRWETLF